MLREAHEEADKKLQSNINTVRSYIFNILVNMIYTHQTEKTIYSNTHPFLYKGVCYMSSPDESYVVSFLDFLKQYHPYSYEDLKTSLEKEYIYLQQTTISFPNSSVLPGELIGQELQCLTITINALQ